MELGQALAKIAILEKQIEVLHIENETLKQKQQAFTDELVAEVQKIEKLSFFKKIFSYGALLKQLVKGVMGAIEKAKTK